MNINLKTYNKILKRSIYAAKQHFLESTFNKYKSDIRNTWKTINKLMSRNKKANCYPSSINIDGIEITNQTDMANTFNTFFTNIDAKLANEISYSGEKGYAYYLRNKLDFKFSLNDVDESIVMSTIFSLPTKSSTGFDNISSKFLKQIAPTIVKHLTTLIKQVFNTGIFPDKLKLARVIPLYKKGNPSLLNNYRPISLLPVISKVIEKILSNQLRSYFESNKLFYENQYGFRSDHSTEYATLELIDRIISKMDNDEIPFSIFLDLSKAFDTIDHKILLEKLKHYGIDGIPFQLFKSYLSDRKQYVEINDAKSDVLQITTGVPQGSILEPVLLIIYINDFSQASQVFNFISYADDTVLFTPAEKS